ncbi:MAG: hypothetical protein N2689_16605 [Verrucomicrobiae bacterium]|nr:hypothetical protein [Verrucomicrobiae bacterium]
MNNSTISLLVGIVIAAMVLSYWQGWIDASMGWLMGVALLLVVIVLILRRRRK